MSKVRHDFQRPESVAFAMMKMNGMTPYYRDFSEFIVIKNESEIIDFAARMEGVGGDTASIHRKVLSILLDKE